MSITEEQLRQIQSYSIRILELSDTDQSKKYKLRHGREQAVPLTWDKHILRDDEWQTQVESRIGDLNTRIGMLETVLPLSPAELIAVRKAIKNLEG